MSFSNGELNVSGSLATAGIFATYPSENITQASFWDTLTYFPTSRNKAFSLSQVTGFFDQIVGTGLLLFCVRGLTDDKNARVPSFVQPFLIGLVVLAIGISFGFNCGYAINPARDLSPRIFSLMAGYGSETFT